VHKKISTFAKCCRARGRCERGKPSWSWRRNVEGEGLQLGRQQHRSIAQSRGTDFLLFGDRRQTMWANRDADGGTVISMRWVCRVEKELSMMSDEGRKSSSEKETTTIIDGAGRGSDIKAASSRSGSRRRALPTTTRKLQERVANSRRCRRHQGRCSHRNRDEREKARVEDALHARVLRSKRRSALPARRCTHPCAESLESSRRQ